MGNHTASLASTICGKSISGFKDDGHHAAVIDPQWQKLLAATIDPPAPGVLGLLIGMRRWACVSSPGLSRGQRKDL